MFHATGPGKIEVDAKFAGPLMLKALLYNFDFDDMASAAIKKEHADFLGTAVVPLLAKGAGHVWLRGTASQAGKAGYNKTLSEKRAGRVGAFLLTKGISPSQMRLDGYGEDLSTSALDDDERDRSVLVLVLPVCKPDPPPPPPRKPTRPPLSDEFKVRMVGSASFGHALKGSKWLKGKIGAGPAADVIGFQIWDIINNLACIYVYIGGGGGAGLYWVSATHEGPWNYFTTSAEMSVAQFDGVTRFTTGGAGPISWNYLHMIGTPPGVDAVYLPMGTGLTVGATASTTVGKMILVSGPDPYSGL